MDKQWAEVSCEVPAEMAEELAALLAEISPSGVSIENLSLDTFALDGIEEAPVKTIKLYFAADSELEGNLAALRAFLAAREHSGAGFLLKEPAVTFIREEDWANSWKEHFKPSRVGRRLVLKPTWEEYRGEEGEIVLEIDPGMAFGTGTHPTTKLCLEALERIYCREGAYAGAERLPLEVLDVGTGSGILTIGAVKLGAERVAAIDIDPEAVRVARENLRQNAVDREVTVSTTPLQKLPGSFDLVLANILAEELVRLAPELVRRLNPGGFLILSGILVEKEGVVREGFAPFRLRLVECAREEEWSCLVYSPEL